MDALIIHGFIYVLIGAFAGLMAGLFGIGGGLVVVPGLLFVFEQTKILPENLLMYSAVGTSLAAMIITTAASLQTHYRIGTILWPVFYRLYPGLLLGTIIGSISASWIPTQWLATFFAIFLLCVAIKMLGNAKIIHAENFPKNGMNFLINLLIGTNSGLLGVGGGILIVPYLTYCGIEIRRISAISNLCALSIAFIGSIAFMVTGYKATSLIPNMTGFVYWPAVLLIGIASSIMAPLGARLNYSVPVHQLRFGFVGILIVTAISMLF